MFSILLYSTFTAQILFKFYSLQLNCTDSNYTEAVATCLSCYRTAYLLHKYCTNSTVNNWTVLTLSRQKLLLHVHCTTGEKLSNWCLLKWNAVGCLILYVYIHNHLHRLNPSNSHYCLQALCRHSDTDKEQVDITNMTGTLQTEGQINYCQSHVQIL